MRVESCLAQIGNRKDIVTGAVSYPVYYAATYGHPALGQSTGFDYSRLANPTRKVLEEVIAALEGGDGGFACASGMAAIQTVAALFSRGDHVVLSHDLYGGTYRLFEQVLARAGVTATYVDASSVDAVRRALRPNTKALFIETPTNPLLQVADIAALAKVARDHGLLLIVDNTLMSPYLQRPLALGADIVVHSATKYLGGHNDVLAGLIVTRGEELTERVAFLHNAIGAVLGPQDSWLLMRGMKTLAVRLDRQQENASRIARFLADHPLVEAVYFPDLPGHPGREVHFRQARGPGALLSFRVVDPALVEPVLRHVQLITFAESLGGVESLITYPAVQTHAEIPEAIRRAVGVDDRLLRLSVGIEHADDLIADLAQALERAAEEVGRGRAKVLAEGEHAGAPPGGREAEPVGTRPCGALSAAVRTGEEGTR